MSDATCAVTHGHERAPKWVTVDDASDLDETPVVFGSTITREKIIEIDLLADREHLDELDLGADP